MMDIILLACMDFCDTEFFSGGLRRANRLIGVVFLGGEA